MKKEETTPAIKFLIIAVLVNLTIGVFTLVWKFNDSQKPNIVYVDAIKLLSEYKGMEYARKEYDLKVSGWHANLDTLKIEMDIKYKEYEEKKSKLTSKELSLMEELLETKQEQFINYQEMISEKVKKEDQELTTKVYTKVNEYLKKYGEEKGYTFILSANQYGSIVYAESATNITEEVLAGLNAEFVK